MGKPETIVITRHASLIEYMREKGIIDSSALIIPRATADDVRGRHVVGPLPLHLAAIAACITQVPLSIPREIRGEELTLEQVRDFAGEPVTYVVREQGLAVNLAGAAVDHAYCAASAGATESKYYDALCGVGPIPTEFFDV